MQLRTKLSIAVATFLATTQIHAEDYVRVNVMQYSENDNRVAVLAPSIEVNKELGVDYTLNVSVVADSVSGGTPVYSDTTSGASAYHKDLNVTASKVKKENIDMSEQRSFASVSLTQRLQNRDEISYGFSKSYESDYDANTLSVGYLMWDGESKNRSYDFGLSVGLNNILIKDCSYNTTCGTPDTVSSASKKETSNTLSTEVGITQILSKEALAKASVFYSSESGYLSNPYYNVVRNNNGTTADVVAENRPEKRTAYGFNLKYIRAMSETLSSQFKYKFYSDDWDIVSHTIDINNYYEFNSDITIGFGLRYYTQSEANFYNESATYFTNQTFASHDERLSSFNAITYNTSLEYKYSNELSYNVGFNLYDQSTNLSATYTSLGLKYKF
jgi:hypothetical protein